VIEILFHMIFILVICPCAFNTLKDYLSKIYIMSNTISMTQRQKNQLERKAKVGWACFYRAEQTNHRLHMEYMADIKNLQGQLELLSGQQSQEISIPPFIHEEIRNLLKKTSDEISCPICLEELEVEQIKFSSCGHKFCESCLSKIDECAVCRRKLYKKS